MKPNLYNISKIFNIWLNRELLMSVSDLAFFSSHCAAKHMNYISVIELQWSLFSVYLAYHTPGYRLVRISYFFRLGLKFWVSISGFWKFTFPLSVSLFPGGDVFNVSYIDLADALCNPIAYQSKLEKHSHQLEVFEIVSECEVLESVLWKLWAYERISTDKTLVVKSIYSRTSL